MNLKCFFGIHSYQETQRVFTPPAKTLTSLRMNDLLFEPLERYVNIDQYGFTNIESKCSNCGKIKLDNCIGKI